MSACPQMPVTSFKDSSLARLTRLTPTDRQKSAVLLLVVLAWVLRWIGTAG
jgi:hypothetical protein